MYFVLLVCGNPMGATVTSCRWMGQKKLSHAQAWLLMYEWYSEFINTVDCLEQGWANSGQMWPATTFSVARRSIQENLQIWHFFQLLIVNINADCWSYKSRLASARVRRYDPPLKAAFSKWTPRKIIAHPWFREHVPKKLDDGQTLKGILVLK